MCGIFSILNNDNDFTDKFVTDQFLKGKNRGPEHTSLKNITIKCEFGFHRLAINGLNVESNQPIIIDEISLICNGEIYNYKELYELMDITATTDSDCEIIIHLYKKYGIDQTLQMLDGVFAFILCDYSINNLESKIFIARDPFGVRPLYKLTPKHMNNSFDNICVFASELKVLSNFYNGLIDTHNIQHFQPGTYSQYKLPFKVSAKWQLIEENIIYHSNGFNSIMHLSELEQVIILNIQYHFINAVKKRVINTDRPVACLLSGGLDSSLVTALVSKELQNSNTILSTFSIGLKDSEDLKYAKIVADYLGTKHREIIITEQTIFDNIPNVIKAIETFDTTTVRASIGNYLLGKYITNFSDAKVIFNGDGSDELTGGYLYMNLADNCVEFDRETRRLIKDIHMFDVLRSDKCISSHGLEPRTPFLDRTFVNYYLGIHPSIRFHTPDNKMEKHLLRMAFSSSYYLTEKNIPLLPDEILWRKKEAFSDGISKTNSFAQIIETFLSEDEELIKKISSSIGNTLEQKYYRYLFDSFYPNTSNIVPYMWMPKYIKATDPSARANNL